MILRRLTKRERGIFFLCLMTACVSIGYQGLIKPLRGRLDSLDRAFEGRRRQFRKDAAALRKAGAVEERYEAYQRQWKQSRPAEEVMSSILAEIETAAGQLKLQISNLKPRRVKETDYYNRFSVSLTIDGRLEDIIHFLHILQSEPHLFEVEELRLDKGVQPQSAMIKTNLALGKIFIP